MVNRVRAQDAARSILLSLLNRQETALARISHTATWSCNE
jgi:hypothetical protein